MNTPVDIDNGRIQQAVSVLRAGGVVAIPTETVYGLGADASNPDAVARVFALKGRPADHPLIVHLPHVDHLRHWAREVSPAARHLAEQFWPGPLTLILKRAENVLDAVTGGQDTVGLRMPDQPLTLALLQAFDGGIAAPSANRYGHVSPTTAAHVVQEFGDQLDLILDGGPCPIGLESTIVDMSTAQPAILRPGAISAEQIAEVLGQRPSPPAANAPRVPGSLASHYAPATPLELIEGSQLCAQAQDHCAAGRRVAVLSGSRSPGLPPGSCHWQQMPGEPTTYGRLLYATLRELDTRGFDCILVERPPAAPGWEAINDRLTRAATPAALRRR